MFFYTILCCILDCVDKSKPVKSIFHKYVSRDPSMYALIEESCRELIKCLKEKNSINLRKLLFSDDIIGGGVPFLYLLACVDMDWLMYRLKKAYEKKIYGEMETKFIYTAIMFTEEFLKRCEPIHSLYDTPKVKYKFINW